MQRRKRFQVFYIVETEMDPSDFEIENEELDNLSDLFADNTIAQPETEISLEGLYQNVR